VESSSWWHKKSDERIFGVWMFGWENQIFSRHVLLRASREFARIKAHYDRKTSAPG